MSLEKPPFDEFSVAGQAYRRRVIETALPEEFRTAEIAQYFHDLPDEVLGVYSETRFYHITHVGSWDTIQHEGLQQGRPIIDKSDQVFFMNALSRFHQGYPHANDVNFAKRMIMGGTERPRGIYLTGQPEGAEILYTIPEGLKFFLRNLHDYSRHETVPETSRAKAAAIIEKYLGALTDPEDNVGAAVLRIDTAHLPLAINMLAGQDLRYYTTEQSIQIVQSFQQETNIELDESVPPTMLNLENVQTFSIDQIMTHIFHDNGGRLFQRSRLPRYKDRS